jgi:hypothetical protein
LLSSGTSRPAITMLNLRADLHSLTFDDDEVGEFAGSMLPTWLSTPRIFAASSVAALTASGESPTPRSVRPETECCGELKAAAREREPHAGLREHPGRLIRIRVKRVFALRQREHARENHRHVVLFQECRGSLQVGAATNDDADVLTLGPGHGIAHGLIRAGAHEHRLAAIENRQERFE